MTPALHHAIRRALGAGVRALALLTSEEDRALAILEGVGNDLGWPVHTWSLASGLDGSQDRIELHELLRRLTDDDQDGLWVLLEPPGSELAARQLRELAQQSSGPACVIVAEDAGRFASIPELVREVLPLPDRGELRAHLAWIGTVLEDAGHDGARRSLEERADLLANAALGLELRSVDRLVAEAVLEHGTDGAAIAAWVREHKPAALDRAGLLERVPPVPESALGGLSELMAWLRQRTLALDPKARDAAIPPPRGVLLVGVQGCGKSLAARVCASVLGLPLIRLEPGRLFGGTVGESEANLRRVITTADRIAPVVMWIDEIDKGLAGADGSASDAGTTARVVGGLLTWLQERERDVFVVATANAVDALPPELLRRGRLDEVFFVDLPKPDERAEILLVHLVAEPERTLGHVPTLADDADTFAAIAAAADGFSGAELAAAVVEARLRAFASDRPLAAADLAWAIESTVPLARSHAEHIDALRAWAQTRARRA